jgi:hypothetical protein
LGNGDSKSLDRFHDHRERIDTFGLRDVTVGVTIVRGMDVRVRV